ncbi:TAXI family TRAP transporter solute-binding subunit [Primorskyibacter aestuariivivens]|uniref:TAXI family TRAP transporter solute-binding subunit n=1 Tax=Primorskyibacter aestuariivivens TaxID=1888912 RepID=UPI002300C77E|nr:TAXI family TRAP transporter solute-binding subunit [Primorskyibacter aestuariivivens]MDA7427477.1 TAXI family TRAP transporter solute-binding subunit [Primorskyibacter aestuariivivens]
MTRFWKSAGFAAAATVAAFALPAQAETRLAFGATNAQSAHYAYFAALAKVVNEANPDYQASVVETGATVDNLKRMERGQLDIGLITTSALYHANNGIKTFDGNQIDSPLLWAYSLAPQNVVVRRDAGVNSLEDLAGQRFGPGQRGSSTEATSLEVLALFGVEPEWVRGSNGELAAAIKDNRAIGFIKSAVGTKFDALTTDIATFTPVQVLPVPEDKVAMIRENLPELSIVDMPGGEMENSGAYQTWGFMIGVSARPDMPEDVAYNIVKAVMEDEIEQATAFPNVKGVNLAELTLQYATTTLHPGAIRYFEEAGYEVPDRLKP